MQTDQQLRVKESRLFQRHIICRKRAEDFN